jgi:hypothetical protein
VTAANKAVFLSGRYDLFSGALLMNVREVQARAAGARSTLKRIGCGEPRLT